MTNSNQNKIKILYLYAGKRKDFFCKWQSGLVPDTQLLGLNHLKQWGFDVKFIEWPFCEWLRKISFNLVHIPYILAIKKYDVVFICAGLPLVFLAKYLLRWHKPKFVIYNTFLVNALKRNLSGLTNLITRKAIGSLDMIVCTSHIQENFLVEQGFDQKKITFVPIGIDASRFANYQSKTSDADGDYILSVGRDLGRDYKTLFEAVKDLPMKVIVATKKEAVAGLTAPENVELRFNIPYGDMPALYHNAKLVVIPLYKKDSLAGSDTSGQYGYLEPMASGKAIITADRPAVRDYIADGEDGFLYEPEIPTDLRKKIELLLTNQELRIKLGKNAKEKVLQEFTSEKFASALAKIFKSL